MNPKIKANCKTTIHRDGTVSYWDIYLQQWERRDASQISDKVLASMTQSDRDAIIVAK